MQLRLHICSAIVGATIAAALWSTSRSSSVANRCDQPPVAMGPVRGFVENLGQWSADVAFAAAGDGEWVRIGPDRFEFGRGAARLTMRVDRAADGGPRGVSPTGAVCNFLLGDPRQHVLGARVFDSVERAAIAPGVDLLLRRAAPGRQAMFAYDLRLQEGARLDDVVFELQGATSMSVCPATGDLVLGLGDGEVRHSHPIAWRTLGDQRVPLACVFVRHGPTTFGFRVAGAAGAADVCIDPDLQWSSNFGGAAIDTATAVDVAANGDVLIAGLTQSMPLPGTAGAFDPTYNGATTTPYLLGDAYVARFAAATGALSWCTFLGGSENDSLDTLRTVGNDAVVAGWTSSTDFPTTPGAFDTSHNGTGDGYIYGGGDVVVARLAANGQSLVWSTFLGGSQLEYATSLAVAPNGDVAVSGHVHSSNFPTTPGAFGSVLIGGSDFFVARLAANGTTLAGSTFCGGSTGEEYPYALAFTADGDILAAGATDSNDLPVTAGVFDPTYNGGSEHLADGFVARFDSACSVLRWCTYLGTGANEHVRGIAVHGNGTMTLTGAIDGPGLPTTPASFGPLHFGDEDGFAWRLSANGSTSLWATYVGGSAEDTFHRPIDLGGGRIAIAGRTTSVDAPVSRGSALPTTVPGVPQGWLVVLGSDGSSVDYGTAVPGWWGQGCVDVARGAGGGLVTVGVHYAPAFPVTPAGLSYAGNGDAFVVQVAGLPTGVTRTGAPSGSCGGSARVSARSGPFVGESAFALTAGDIPPASPALAAVTTAVLATSLPVSGIDLWIDPTTLLVTAATPVDPHGCARLSVPVPAVSGLAGAALAAQFVWLDACPGFGFGASDAVAIVIQP